MRWIRVGTIVATVGLVVTAAIVGFRSLPSDAEKGDPVRVGTTDTVSSLDPAGAYDAGSWSLFGNVYQSLMTFLPGSSDPVPDAARSCRFTGIDLLEYRCEMRTDVHFSNGRRMTAQDVRYSFNRISAIKSPLGPMPLLSTLKGVHAEGNTVTFELSAPDAMFPYKIATGAGAIVDSTSYPAKKLRAGVTVTGSGPFVLQSYHKGQRAELVPNETYKGAVRSLGGRVSVRYFSDPEKLSDAWKGHRVDVAFRQMPPTVLAALSSPSSGARVVENSGGGTRYLIFNLRQKSIMSKPAVRQAAAALIDRPALSRDVHHRTVEPLYSLVPKGIGGHTTSFFDKNPNPSPARARALLQEAGVSTPIPIKLAYSQGAATDLEAEELGRQLEKGGLFKVTTKWYEWPDFQKGYTAGKFDAYTIGWIPDFPGPDSYITSLVGSDSPLHDGYKSKKVDDLIRTTQRDLHRSRAVTSVHTIQDVIADEAPILPLWQKKDYVLGTDTVSGTQYLSDGTGIWRLWQLHRI